MSSMRKNRFEGKYGALTRVGTGANVSSHVPSTRPETSGLGVT